MNQTLRLETTIAHISIEGADLSVKEDPACVYAVLKDDCIASMRSCLQAVSNSLQVKVKVFENKSSESSEMISPANWGGCSPSNPSSGI